MASKHDYSQMKTYNKAVLLRLMNSQQAQAGVQQAGLTPQGPNEDWEVAGLRAGWGSDTVSQGFAWSLRDLSTPEAKEKPNSGFPHDAKHTKGSWN